MSDTAFMVGAAVFVCVAFVVGCIIEAADRRCKNDRELRAMAFAREIGRLESKPKWISVEERLPEKHTRVLCYFKYEPESPNVICENLYHGDGSWLGNGNLVTHWMPLPEPPNCGADMRPRTETKGD